MGSFSNANGKPKLWKELKNELQFIYNQIIATFYSKILERCTYSKPREYQKSHFPGSSFNKNHQIYCLNKLNSKEIYSILIESSDSKPYCQLYYKNVFQNSNLDWKAIYMLPRIVTKDSRLRVFQYKLLNNVLYLPKMLFKFGKNDSPLCSTCKIIDSTSHLL